MKIYNTLSKTKEEFQPINPGKVSMYTCGPTVYDYIHIGNIKSYLTADILRRYLEYSGYEVRHIKNITDVGHLTQDDLSQGDTGEDKIEKKALKEKKTPKEIADFYESYFHNTEKEVNILPAHYFPKATAHVTQMIKIIEKLLEKGYAYEKNGNVFFDLAKFSDYGKLSGNTLENLKVGARLEEHPDKKNPWDFALWLKAPENHIMKWESPWGIGYPGWHIECTAMSTEYLGNTLDIHTGGEDNIFPHHEAEIAQSQCATDKKFVNYWVHTRLLLINGEKMSKSKGNFYTLEDIKKRGYDPMVLRLALMSTHHRNQLNFTWQSMDQSKSNYERIAELTIRLKNISEKNIPPKDKIDLEEYKKRFDSAMNDDLNVPLALTVVYELITQTNKLIAENKLGSTEAGRILNLWNKVNKVLGLEIRELESIPREIKDLAEQRTEARKNKDFQAADKIREEIHEKGYSIEDTAEGYEIKKI